MRRRSFLAAGLSLPFWPRMAQANLLADHPLQASWQSWKALCLTPEGRIVDGFQGSASHSEGQGYGLTLAAIFGDAEAAARIIAWTESHLALRPDGLLVWRWYPDRTPAVEDYNNASDGDLFYAWGLLLAAPLGDEAARRERAFVLARALATRCIVDHPDGSGQPLLLPGVEGFQTEGSVILNPSYYMPRALQELAEASGVTRLSHLAYAGRAMIERLAEQGPMPDWIQISATGITPAPAPFSGNSGYEAIRVALFEMWSGGAESVSVSRFPQRRPTDIDAGGTPTILSPTGEILERSPHPGYAAIEALAICASQMGVGSAMPAFSADQPYYPATLHLMALAVQATLYPRCVPL